MSPDESCYNRLIFLRENVSNALVMMQPSLICYSFQSGPQPVLLDAASVRPDVILLLDTFFHVLIFHGETIAQWREGGFAERPEHDAFRSLLQVRPWGGESRRRGGGRDRVGAWQRRLSCPLILPPQVPKADAATIVNSRFPVPRYIVCDQHKSQSRFLMAKLNPSVTHNNTDASGVAPVFTDDVSFSVFMDSLVKLSTAT